MLLHKLLEQVLLLLLIARRLPHLLLLLIVHHLLDQAPGLAVELAQLTVLGHDLLHVDLGRVGRDVRPPRAARGLGDGDVDFLARSRACGIERPGRVVDFEGVRGVALLNGKREGYVNMSLQVNVRAGVFGFAPLAASKAKQNEWNEEGGYVMRLTSIMAAWPLICTLMWFFLMSTIKSFDLRFPGIGSVTSASASVCVHLYGNLDCSSSSLALASASSFARSEGVGEDVLAVEDMVAIGNISPPCLLQPILDRTQPMQQKV